MTERSPSVDIGDVVAAFAALRRENTRVLQAIAAEHAITRTDLRAVVHLHSIEVTTPKALGEFLDLTQGSITALVDRVERAGLAARAPHPSDRRSLLLRLTPAGVEVAERAGGVFERAFLGAIHSDDLQGVHGTFTRVADALRAYTTQDADRARV